VLSENQRAELLAAFPVLRSLPPQLWQKVISEGQYLCRSNGSIAFDEGDACRSSVMVTAGSIRVIRSTRSGRELLLYRITPGEDCILTVSCLLGDCAYQARGIVEADLTFVAVPRAVFMQLIEQSPEFRTAIFRFFGERVTRLMELIEATTFRRLDRRLAMLLVTRGPVIATTHQYLADELGSVREVISRILEEFQAQNFVRLERGQVYVLDEAALREQAYAAL
jgi:CRP/FNR family transcriptional regulator, anaerobic regulatory protein